MEKHLKGDKNHPRTTVVVEENLVAIKHVTLFDNGEHWYLETTVDMRNCSSEDIQKNAAMNYLIQNRSKFLKNKLPIDIDEGDFLDPTTIEKRVRIAKAPKDAARDNLAKLTQSEFVAFMGEEYGVGEKQAINIYKKKHS